MKRSNRKAAVAACAAILLATSALLPAPTSAQTAEKDSATETDADASDEMAEGSRITGEEYQDLSEDARPVDPAVLAPDEEGDPKGYSLRWDQGIRFDRNDGAFRLKLGFRLEGDLAVITGDESIESEIGGLGTFAEVRRAWITASGTIGSRFLYKAQVDVTGQSTGDDNRNAYAREIYLAAAGLGPLGTVKLGFQREPFSMADLTSSLALSFMERALPAAFAPAYNFGISSKHHAFDRRIAWSYGIFRYSGSEGKPSSRINLTGRITGLPIFKDKGRRLLHIGASYSHQFRDSFQLRYRRRPESRLAERFIDTGSIPTESVDLFSIELIGIGDSWTLSTEFVGSRVGRSGGGSNFLWGAYTQLSYFLTGEVRPYRRRSGLLGRVEPLADFDWGDGGLGAWEISARYSYADFDDGDVRGGILGDVSLGFVWHLRPHLRLLGNYIHAHRNGVGDANIVQFRLGIDY